MNLQQLRYLREVVRSGFNISRAARNLHTSQPGVSTQLRRLEHELGIRIFARNRRGLFAVEESARPVVELACRILADIEDLRRLARAQVEGAQGLVISTAHSLARYMLPQVLARFSRKYPEASLALKYGDPSGTLTDVARGAADVAVTAEVPEGHLGLAVLRCYVVPRKLVAPPGHPLLRRRPLTLEAIAAAPMIAYDATFTGRRIVDETFRKHGLAPKIVLTALDADGVKACVEHGLGIAILSVSFDPKIDRRLRAVDVDHLFEPSTIYLSARRGNTLNPLVADFIEMFAPHLDRGQVAEALWSGRPLPEPVARGGTGARQRTA
jgi:LysR family cys regulon transcriptional activator